MAVIAVGHQHAGIGAGLDAAGVAWGSGGQGLGTVAVLTRCWRKDSSSTSSSSWSPRRSWRPSRPATGRCSWR